MMQGLLPLPICLTLRNTRQKHTPKITYLRTGEKTSARMPFFHPKGILGKNSAQTTPSRICFVGGALHPQQNARTTLAMLLPTMPTCQSIQFLQTDSVTDLMMMLALFNSKPFDFLVRLKMPGIDLTQSVIRQTPVPSRDIYQRLIQFSNVELPLEHHILERVAANPVL